MSNIPKLRFKEFSGEWEKKALKFIVQDFIVPMRDKPKELIGSIPWCRIEDFDGKYLFDSKSNQGVSIQIVKDMNLKIYPIDTLLVSCSADLGRCAIVKKELITNQTFIGLVPKHEQVNVEFLFYGMVRLNKVLNSLSSGTTISYLSRKEFEKFEITLPYVDEQQKIASFLSAVDTKIEQLTRKKELLEQYKKGVMQKLFSQELRFKADDGSEFPEWEEKKLGEVCDCLDNLRKPLNDEERQKIQGDIPYWGANNIMGYVNDYLFDETIVLLAEDGGNFNEYRTRPIANISYGKCWVNNHTHVLRGKAKILINEFLYYSVVHKNITGYVSGGTRAKLTKGEMLKIEIQLPSFSEQTKIANFLSVIDTKIDFVAKQLNEAKNFKKGLLQQMFV